jgi:hypothetical protein
MDQKSEQGRILNERLETGLLFVVYSFQNGLPQPFPRSSVRYLVVQDMPHTGS